MTLLSPFIVNESCHVSQADKRVLVRSCDYDNTLFDDSFFAQVEVDFPPQLERAVVKRKAEYLVGRYLSRQLIAQLGLGNVQIGAGKARQPTWPEGYCGSISHTAKTAVCAGTADPSIKSVGIDREHWISPETAANIAKSIVNDQEHKHLRTHFMSFERALTVGFSAKESVFKALYPFVGNYFGFDKALLQIERIDDRRYQYVAVIQADLSTQVSQGDEYVGTIDIEEHHVTTQLIVER